MTVSGNPDTPSIPRHKTAIRRPDLSLPVKCLLRDDLMDADRSLFDYGCGYGQDIERLQSAGIACDGWDPFYRPDAARASAPVVNLGYVINVIENPDERAQTLQAAWQLCDDVLVVSAIGPVEPPEGKEIVDFADGMLTSRGTFQKHYRHEELRAYLEQQLPCDAVPAAPNIFYLFKSEELRQQFLSIRYRRRLAVPRKRVSELLFENNRDVLDPFMEALTRLGRLPGQNELSIYPELVSRFGSLKRAFLVVRRATGEEPWKEIEARRTEDLLVYLALARFGRRRPLSHLPLSTQLDIKAFMGAYSKALDEANTLLFSIGNADAIDQACQRSKVGHLVENALVIRRESLDHLEPILRVYEGCARAILGEVEGANMIKLHRYSGKVSYLVCKDLNTDPNPPLLLRVKVDLPNLAVSFFDSAGRSDPPRLGISPALL